MRRITVIALLVGVLLAPFASRSADGYVRVGVSVSFFYGELAPYGRWIDCSYGAAWVPWGIAPGWQPYCNGEWVLTDYGWTWVSFDPWGGDPFHYGAWTWDDPWGWIWIPGTVWSPAWVTWCWGDGFIGWAPLGPSFTLRGGGYFGAPVVASRASYVFVPDNRFAATSVTGVRMPLSQNAVLLRQGRTATRFDVRGGTVTEAALPVSRVQAAMGGRVPRVQIAAARTDPRPVGSAESRFIPLVVPAGVGRAALAHAPAATTGRAVSSNRSGAVVGRGSFSPWRERRVQPAAQMPARIPGTPAPRRFEASSVVRHHDPAPPVHPATRRPDAWTPVRERMLRPEAPRPARIAPTPAPPRFAARPAPAVVRAPQPVIRQAQSGAPARSVRHAPTPPR